MRGRILLLAACLEIFLAQHGELRATGARQQDSPAVSPASADRALLDRYCVTCHNEKLLTAGLTLDSMDVANVSTEAAAWEKVVKKLRTRAMPPPGRPRPDDAEADAVASSLESRLDRAVAAAPNPGREPAVRRLTRTEYQNAIRDLLALEALPKEMDPSLLLPPDGSASGFDTYADVLFVSPTALEGYLSAARKISRMAVGDPTMPLIVDTHTLPLELPQDQHFEGLPFGTRGGTLIRSDFPLDGEYELELETGGRIPEPHELEISVDGERVHLFTLGPKGAARSPLGPQYSVSDGALKVRLPIKAGPRAVGVTFVEKTSAPADGLRRAFLRGRGQQPWIARVTVTGPFSAGGVGDTPSRRRIFGCYPASSSEERPCAERILSTLARRAYRRPATVADSNILLPFYEAGRNKDGFEAGIQRALERLLVSPGFLFRVERDPANVAPDAVYRISDLELASRLSFFLWSSIPDDELLDAATRGELKNPAVLERQVQRMLADPRSRAIVTNFASQWLYLRDLDVKRPDDGLFPNFDQGLQQAFRHETELFLDSILREDHSVLDLLRANYTFVNERLARHYGIPNVYGSQFRRVTLDPASERGGLLGHGSILTLTSYPTRTSPVLRGKWILENILSQPPPPPPPNVPALKDSTAEGKILSMRDRMVQHRANPVCASCHSRMDPLGFALENFDAVGQWRTRSEANAPIDVSAMLPNGTAFEGVKGLKDVLLSQPEEFVITIVDKLLAYGLGRNPEYYDAPAIRKITRDASGTEYRFASLVLGVVKSVPFQMRRSQS